MLIFGLPMNAKAQDIYEHPPTEPTGEHVIQDASAFGADCLGQAQDLAAAGRLELGTPLLTRSDKWGVVWRVDFKIAGQDLQPLVNRIVCWNKPDGSRHIEVAIGQSIRPLPGS